jgi:hypothetical protein
VPRGDPRGGQWTSDGGGSEASAVTEAAFRMPDANASDNLDIEGLLQDAGYTLSPEMQRVARDLYRLFMEGRGDPATLQAYLESRGLTIDDLPDVLRSLFDPPRSLGEL